MDRRNFLKISSSVVGLSVLSSGKRANALLFCTPFNFQGFQQCEAGIDSRIINVTTAATGGQHMNQWCWAACIEMVFRYYGFYIPQEAIVQQTWGSIVNLPAHQNQILANLNRPWRDSHGRAFLVSGNSYSANPTTAVQDLVQNMPLIIGTMGHAMVLTSLRYLRNQWGNLSVTAAVVRDPWPGKGRRVLSAQEWFGTSFLVRIRVIRV